VSLYEISGSLEDLVAPVLIAAFDGWIDAAGAASAAANHLASDATTVLTFDPDPLYDYRSRRPVLDVIDGVLRHLAWPEMAVRRLRVGDRDLLILHGPEPDFRWRELSRDVLRFAKDVGVAQWITLGAIPAAVPHTRPAPVFATASREGLLKEGMQQGPGGLLRVPSACLSVIELTVAEGGIPAVGFYAQIPPYVGGPYATATIALLDIVGRHLGETLPLGALPDEARTQRMHLDAAVAAQEDMRQMVEQLEVQQQGETESIPTGDELASEIERYLRGQGGESRSGDPGF
jgi:predicted ATP-grasp superfamily ATP-dependent carboligase